MLLGAARRIERFDRRVARETYRDAFIAVIYAGRFARDAGPGEVAAAILSAAPSTDPPSASDRLLDAAAALVDGGYASGAGEVREAIASFRLVPAASEEELQWLWFAGRVATWVWDDDTLGAISARLLDLVRDSGMLAWLPMAAALRVNWELFAGDLDKGLAHVSEHDNVFEAIGGESFPGARIALAAFRGHEAEVARLDEATTPAAVARGDGPWVALRHWSTAVLCNGLGRYDEALTAARLGAEYPADMQMSSWAMSELVEAAVRCGRPEAAARSWGRRRRRALPRGDRPPRAHAVTRRARARICSTASGCGARGAAATPVTICAPRTGCSP